MSSVRIVVGAALVVACMTVVHAEPSLESDRAKFSYAIGLQITQSLMRQGVDVEAQAFTLAVDDVLAGRDPRLPPEELEAVLERHEQRATENLRERARRNLAEGSEFRKEFAQREDVRELESGLLYRVLRQGDGPRPQAQDTVKVHYTGWLIDGREFDSSHRREEPATLAVNGVIPGWQEALQLMPVGSRWELVVPPDLAYGARGAGAVIGPNQTLIFTIELLGIE